MVELLLFMGIIGSIVLEAGFTLKSERERENTRGMLRIRSQLLTTRLFLCLLWWGYNRRSINRNFGKVL